MPSDFPAAAYDRWKTTPPEEDPRSAAEENEDELEADDPCEPEEWEKEEEDG